MYQLLQALTTTLRRTVVSRIYIVYLPLSHVTHTSHNSHYDLRTVEPIDTLCVLPRYIRIPTHVYVPL